MNWDQVITKARNFAREQAEQYNVPAWHQITYATAQSIRLAQLLDVNVRIVETAAWLMDSQLGAAREMGKGPEHPEIAAQKVEELFSGFNVPSGEKANIISSIRQHHGSAHFDTIEAEVVCNADCYKYVSLQGFMISFRYTREMPLDDLVKLTPEKVEEKWNALSLDICRQELQPQYECIKQLLSIYQQHTIDF